MSRGLCLPFLSEMLIKDCVAVAGSKALSVKTPSTPVSMEPTAGISKKSWCRIIHDPERPTPGMLTLTGLKSSCYVWPLSILGASRFQRLSLLFPPPPQKKKNVTLCVCLWQKWNVLHESRWARGPTSLARHEFVLAARERASIFSTSVKHLWTKLWNHILLSLDKNVWFGLAVRQY